MVALIEILFELICVFVIQYRVIYYFQINNYKFPKSENFKNEFNRIFDLSIVALLINLLMYYLSYETNIKYLSYISSIIYIFMSIVHLVKSKPNKQKTRITRRLIRILILSNIITYVVILCVIYLGCFMGDAVLFLPIVLIVIPIDICIAIFILKPLEWIINKVLLNRSRNVLKVINPKIIAITGSFGKTSVKEYLYTLLSEKYKVSKTIDNYNTLIGISKSIMAMANDSKIFICEFGARYKKDILKLCKYVLPDVGIITGIIGQHLDTFKNIENVYSTKKELLDCLVDKPVFFNTYNDLSLKMHNEYKGEKYNSKSFISFYDINYYYDHTEFKMRVNECVESVSVNIVGESAINNLELCANVAYYLGVNKQELLIAFSKLIPVKHRLEIMKLKNGITVLDDSYNANIYGVLDSLNIINSYDGRKIILAQGIVEGGVDNYNNNYKIGEKIADIIDTAIIVGVNKTAIINGIKSKNSNTNIISAISFDDAKKTISQILKKGDCLLIQNDLTDNY